MQCTRHVSGITFIRYAQGRNIGKPNNSEVFERNTAKGPKQDSLSHLRSLMTEGGEPYPKMTTTNHLITIVS